MEVFLSVISGLAVGSFLNVVVARYEKRETLGGRSRCPYCRHTLSWRELVPVLSFIALSGRCRYCRKKISLAYPLVELAVAAIFGLAAFYYFLGSPVYFLWLCAAGSVVVLIGAYDLKY